MRRREDFPLEKVTLNLFKGENARLQTLYPRAGAGKIIRELVHAHLRKVEEAIAHRRVGTVDLQVDLEEVLDEPPKFSTEPM